VKLIIKCSEKLFPEAEKQKKDGEKAGLTVLVTDVVF